MEALSRLVKLHKILSGRHGPVSVDALQDRLGCSRPTLYRVIARLRDDLGAPIVNVRGSGYQYDRTDGEFELPGLWLSPEELHSLLAMDALLAQIQPGVLHEALEPVRYRIERLLSEASPGRALSVRRVRERVQVMAAAARRVDPKVFGVLVTATLQRKQLAMTYHGRTRDVVGEREVSPLRLKYYRDNWYLDGWCHAAEGLRRFSVDRVQAVAALSAAAVAVPSTVEQAAGGDGYGIFTGAAQHKAVLRFTPERAKWVADEVWHPEQKGQMATDGSYELTVPYGDARELIGDILRHGSGVEVVRPKALRTSVAESLRAAALLYG